MVTRNRKIINNGKHNENLIIIIKIGIQRDYYDINWHIMVISVTFWIKSRLIIIINKKKKKTNLLDHKGNYNQVYQYIDWYIYITISNLSLIGLELNIRTTKK